MSQHTHIRNGDLTLTDELRGMDQADNIADPATRAEILHKAGQGNWRAFRLAKLDMADVLDSAADWANAVSGIEKPWLCWNVDSDWCLAQQRLVRHVGWTPIIGYDPRVGPPKEIVPGAVVVDFNEKLRLPVLYPHFAMEFAFLFCKRLAFWHSDLLVRLPLLEEIAAGFDAIEDGETIATKNNPGIRYAFQKKYQRYWELIGCTTQGASKSQFDAGCGWWMGFADHINCRDQKEYERRLKYYWDHGAGIYYWHRNRGGRVRAIADSAIHEGHCTKIGNPSYQRSVPVDTCDAQRSMSSELSRHFDLTDVCKRMGLDSVCLS